MKSKQKYLFKETEIGKVPVDWEVDKLENHLIIKGRIGWKGLKTSEYVAVGPFIVGGLQIVEDRIVWKKCAHVTKNRYYESPEIMLDKEDILMTKDGTIGKLAIVEELPNKATVASHIHVIRKNSQKILPQFLFYFFKSPQFQSLIQSKITGSVIPALTQKDINNTSFPIPPIHEQQKISKLFHNLQKQIYNLQNQNQILEQIVQVVFKSWFVDFDGVTEFEDSELGKIPKGWTAVKLEEHTTIKGRIGWKGLKRSEYLDEGHHLITGKQLVNGTVSWNLCPKISEKRYLESPEIMLQKNDILMSKDGTIGRLSFIHELFFTAAVGTGIFVIRPNSKFIDEYFLLAFFKSKIFKNIVSSRIEGSVIPHLYQRDIKNFNVALASHTILQKFSVICKSITQIQYSNISQIETLTKTRDALLPKLMSGEIRI